MSLNQNSKDAIWHPLTHYFQNPTFPLIKKAKGSYLYTKDGKALIDGISSWYTCMYGHCNEKITNKVKEQLDSLHHLIFSSFTHSPAQELSSELQTILPKNQKKIFFSDNGSTAVEVGIKIAFQYFKNIEQKKTHFLVLENGFHGDTVGAMSASGLSVYNQSFEELFIKTKTLPVPDSENIEKVLNHLDDLLKKYSFAGIIYEPMVQGAAGMNIIQKEPMKKLLEFCREKEILLIADEVMTGLGKTGKYFASEYLLEPDILAVSKSLTAGIVPMGVTSCTQNIFDAFVDKDTTKSFFHAHTYTANPVACASALAATQLLKSKDIQDSIQKISEKHMTFVKSISSFKNILNPRSIGAIMAFELDLGKQINRYGNIRQKIYDFFIQRGVFLRPLGNTIYTLPPFTISTEELHKVYDSILELIHSAEKGHL